MRLIDYILDVLDVLNIYIILNINMKLDGDQASLNCLFFEELNKLFKKEECLDGHSNIETKVVASEEISSCYITNEPLDEKTKIVLECNHEFNYEPLFNEVKQQKLGHNSYRRKHLANNQIRCPYCRHVQNKILPYHPGISSVEKIRCINHPAALSISNGTCDYVMKSGKNKGNKCEIACYFGYCTKHLVSIEKQKQKDNHNGALVKNGNTEFEKQTPTQLMKFKLPELRNLAKHMGGKKYSRLNKKDLVAFIHSLY